MYKTLQSNKFTEEDIKILVKQFKMDFPTGKVTKEKSLAIVRKVFPRSVQDSKSHKVVHKRDYSKFKLLTGLMPIV